MKSYEEIHSEKNKCIIDIIPNFIPNKIDEKIQINIYGNEKAKYHIFILKDQILIAVFVYLIINISFIKI